MATSEFMVNLGNELISERGIAKATAMAYMKRLYRINGDKEFDNLGFLQDYGAVDAFIKTYKNATTQHSYYVAIIAVLSVYKDKGYDEDYNHYRKALDVLREQIDHERSRKKTDKQESNWLSWTDVIEVREKLRGKTRSIVPPFTKEQHSLLTQYILLSLLTYIPPRRSLDWVCMYVVRRWSARMTDEHNYYDLETNQFIFNRYKTAKKYGVQKVEVPPDLKVVLDWYLEIHPDFRPKQRLTKQTPLLFRKDGDAYNNSAYITRILNTAFAGNVSTTLLRSIYITDTHGPAVKAMESDAEAMAHSVSVAHKHYLKED
jgi:tetratricopeptide (TPR) repeat protein